MLQRLIVREGQTEEAARREFDTALGVSAWRTPGHRVVVPVAVEPRDPAAPDWWHGDDDASNSFLASMGVTLDA
ncbi:hypothetical protein [Streptomyces iconiensis]|uniref:Uncharacterized protein n=1 Tax=Streptomyces iconiensis TaxID=1384038 RepID=A0ABT7A994_9ACTN|nr:hypothetical protein [Streptomyces iconiensis]MDJ1137928.1 hypothetical protein [Streptomyces iconiensis]